MAVTAAVAADVALVGPPEFVAVTTTRSVWPTSAEVSLYVDDPAPVMLAHASPDVLQSSHW